MDRYGGGRLIAIAIAGALCAACTPVLSLQTADTVPEAVITTAPAAAASISPREPIEVAVRAGRLVGVEVSGPKGTVPGTLAADGRTWVSADAPLEYGTDYQVTATAVDRRGNAATTVQIISTVDPSRKFSAELVSPAPGSTVGVGMPITVRFDRSIKDRAAVESALVVTTPTPVVGAWSWQDDQTVQFRPLAYWPGNIDVTVAMDTYGVQAGKGTYGRKGRESTFHIGPSMVTRVDAQRHHADVFRDGQRIRTIPITTGKPGFETRSGVKVIMSKERSRIMDAATTGTPTGSSEYYRLKVEYAMRVTNTGEFLHAAPWSVGSQGLANVSHGCVGMSTLNASWLYDESSVGDVVEVTGTDNPQNLGNGITVWNEDWPTWLSRSATGAHLTRAAGVSTSAPSGGVVTLAAAGS